MRILLGKIIHSFDPEIRKMMAKGLYDKENFTLDPGPLAHNLYATEI